MHLNNNLALLIPGLTYGGIKSQNFMTSMSLLIEWCDKMNVGSINAYISTWDHPQNNIQDIRDAFDSLGITYQCNVETYGVLDDLVDWYLGEDPAFGEMINEWLSSYYRNDELALRWDVLRRHLAIYYKWYDCWRMVQNEKWIFRVKSQTGFRMYANPTHLEEWFASADNDPYDKDSIKPTKFSVEQNFCRERFRENNAVFCGVHMVDNNGSIKVNENIMFSHHLAHKKLFNYKTPQELFLHGPMIEFRKHFTDNWKRAKLIMKENNYPTVEGSRLRWPLIFQPACGSNVWGDYFNRKGMNIIGHLAHASPQDREFKKDKFY